MGCAIRSPSVDSCRSLRLMHSSLRALSLSLALLGATATAAPKPNIIIILSDDMGYSDLGCYGGEIRTPTLDSLASGGLRFTQFYNTGRCCPTRASLLTGLHPHQAGVGHMTDDHGLDGYRGNLNNQCATIAGVLKPAGYRTYMCGKWHVTRHLTHDSDNSAWPLQRGFEKFYGTIKGGGNYYDPTALCRQNTFITPVTDPEYKTDQYYYTDAISDNAVRYLEQHGKESPEKPFFLYLAYTAAHWPLHAHEKDVAKYKGQYDKGYEAVRVARFARMKELGLLAPDAKLTPAAADWADVKDKAWEARNMEVYAAMVDSMDQGIGRVVNQLKKDGRLENTLIFYLQDNGGCAETIGRTSNGDGPGNLKPMAPGEFQTRTSPPMQTRDGRWVRSGPGVMAGPVDTFLSYGKGWANVSNTPFREYKHWTHEGGISTPLIAHWPAGIAEARRGKLEPQPGQLVDLMATCVDVAGATYPTEQRGEKIKPMEGASLAPAFGGGALARSKPLVWEHEGNRAVREGKWKLVAMENRPWELYDIDADRIESNNLAATQPEKVKELAAAWDAWAARANVLPLGGWRGKPRATKAGTDGLNTETRFDLKAGEHFDRKDAPAIAKRGFSITTKFSTGTAKTGVLVAQGGTAHGYALYLKEGRLHFTVRRGNKATSVATDAALSGTHTAVATLDSKGRLTLKLDDSAPKEDASIATPITTMPTDGLDVGSDAGGLVGDYSEENAFKGTLESLVITLTP